MEFYLRSFNYMSSHNKSIFICNANGRRLVIYFLNENARQDFLFKVSPIVGEYISLSHIFLTAYEFHVEATNQLFCRLSAGYPRNDSLLWK